jgi:hypothetical protein
MARQTVKKPAELPAGAATKQLPQEAHAGVAKALARLERAFTEMESLKSDLKGLLGESKVEANSAVPDQYVALAQSNEKLRRRPGEYSEDGGKVEGSVITYDKHVCGCKTFIFVPGSAPLAYWTFFGMLFVMYEMFVTPYRLCFNDDASPPFSYIEEGINVFFILDFAMQFHMGYYDKKGQVVTDQRKIIREYTHSWMIFDFVAMFPVHWLQHLIWGESSLEAKASRAVRLIRILRFLRILRILKISKYSHLFEQLEGQLENPIKLFLVHIFELLFFLCMVAHLAGCFWFSLGETTRRLGWYEDAFGEPVSWTAPSSGNIPDDAATNPFKKSAPPAAIVLHSGS